MNKKHILVVSQYFYPEEFRINDICKEWVSRGYKVSVATGIPNYPKGEFFDGYSLTKKRHEIWNDIEIFRIPLIPRGNSSIGMVLNYLSFMINGWICGKTKKINPDYVFSFEVSPITQVVTGVSFSKRLHVPHYLYVQDLWPENLIEVANIHSPLIIKPINKLVDYIYKNTDQIFTTSPSFVETICNRGVPKEKVHYWPQYAEEFYKPFPKNKQDDAFTVIFTGNIGKAQGLDILPKTAELLKDQNIKFMIVGDGRYKQDFKQEIINHNVQDKFVLIDAVPAQEIPTYLAKADVAFLSFSNSDLWKKTIPAKLQSYMACAMPIVASADGETKRIINEANCGICTQINNPQELAQALKELQTKNLSTMSQNSRNFFERNFDKNKLMDEMGAKCFNE